MRVLVTGASGMLGSTIVEQWRDRHEVFATGGTKFVPPAAWRFRPFDLSTSDHRELAAWARPELIVHCAAWTAVDACEADPDRANEINGRSVERLLAAAPDARMIFISTDAIGAPVESDPPTPVNAYGRSKLLGESLVGDRGVIARTTVVGWNLDPSKQSFIEWFTRALGRAEMVTLFEDALFTPIAASQLADELDVVAQGAATARGVWNITGREGISKYDFGMQLAATLGLPTSNVQRGTMTGMQFRAPRSADQRLTVASYERHFARRLPAVAETIEALVRDRTRMERKQ